MFLVLLRSFGETVLCERQMSDGTSLSPGLSGIIWWVVRVTALSSLEYKDNETKTMLMLRDRYYWQLDQSIVCVWNNDIWVVMNCVSGDVGGLMRQRKGVVKVIDAESRFKV